jgi:hypothetical protein
MVTNKKGKIDGADASKLVLIGGASIIGLATKIPRNIRPSPTSS